MIRYKDLSKPLKFVVVVEFIRLGFLAVTLLYLLIFGVILE